MSQPPSNPPPAVLACPHCLQAVSVPPGDPAGPLICPHCGGEFMVPALGLPQPVGGQMPIIDYEAPDPHRDDELDGMHIRQVAHLRRSAIRSRSYCMIATAVCAVGAGQMVWLLVARLQAAGWHPTGDRWTPVLGYVVLALFLVRWAIHFYRKAKAFHAEAQKSALTEPTTPPDFTALSDGSQRWKTLEDMNRHEDP